MSVTRFECNLLVLLSLWSFTSESTVAAAASNKCPSITAIKPCKCDQLKQRVICSSSKKFDSSKVFKSIKTNDRNVFVEFYANPLPFFTLDEHFFDGLRFRRISIVNSDLFYIDPNAFKDIETTIRALIFTNNKLSNFMIPGRGDLFDAFRYISDLRVIVLHSNQLTEIPSNAFVPSHQQPSKLWFIDLSKNVITTIGENAFASLEHLTYLDLSNNRLKYLKRNSFAMISRKVARKLTMFISDNALNANSFEIGIWTNINRPLELYLHRNEITFLNRSIFEPLLLSDIRHSFELEENLFACDCKFKWIFDRQTLFKQRLKGITCHRNEDVWNLNASFFRNCSSLEYKANIESDASVAKEANVSREMASSETYHSNHTEVKMKSFAENEILTGDMQEGRYCPVGFYHCQHGACIPLSYVCNSKSECIHGDDEDYCDRKNQAVKEVLLSLLLACSANASSALRSINFNFNNDTIKLIKKLSFDIELT
ncbi:oplophorus-luciferin 2-monooxygenase non-catalytic subunit-like protein [Dinothrombium tinctorium]|uniref:Oplophorus-luciferin 2-monooxygenase non-catalytic subunit-like protein n=1 Tax=Dinothrombium tinctorium TaxID=1965070 RepID=A0A3S3P870_9ACAR|nr:oplophorus-luciferin 2-monooxygenase non-catalytic subunit-like protein [Dinothrombium tinctorium]